MLKQSMTEGYIFDIKRYATHDGPGIRTTVFLSGCPLRCWWCHNPEGMFLPVNGPGTDLRAPAGRGVERGFVGKVSVDQVMEEVEKDVVYYDQSGGGTTFSGGEPFMQPDFLQALLRACRDQTIHTAVDTSGFVAPAILENLAVDTKLFLYDVKFIDDELHQKYTGVSNREILANLTRLDEWDANVILRIPLVPGITVTRENIDNIIGFLLSNVSYRQVSLLPYHQTADAKYERLNLENKMAGIDGPTAEEIDGIRKLFEDSGFKVKVGG
jgi:pyruvate formate lyase activating enzyme